MRLLSLLFLIAACKNSNATSWDAVHALPGLTVLERLSFDAGLEAFEETDSVDGSEAGAEGVGLGPRFNSNSCVSCHSHPEPGGTSPAVNPLVGLANQFGARNMVPSFVIANSPIREVRFKFGRDGSRDGGVKNLFVISGRRDAGACAIAQPNFEREARRGNISFRIPTPVFGAGLIEQIPDSVILANKSAEALQKLALGIHGHENRNGNDGSVTRFGWKAQNKSLMLFAAEAYNVEMGVTNEIFQNEREEDPRCALNATPEDHVHLDASTPVSAFSDVTAFANFMRFLAPPPAPIPSATLDKGRQVFVTVGCANCHTPALHTGFSVSAALSNQPVNLYSDLLVHHMGPGLADDIVQGDAGPDEFRTAPLWGVGKRLFFLHDGRARDLVTAIQAHASSRALCIPTKDVSCASEANAVIHGFNTLKASDRDALIAFLKAL